MNQYETIESAGAPIKAWIKGVPVEDAARAQLINIAQLPFIYRHVAVMPDVHLGKGATVGAVIATKGAIVPAAVGVDIGCGMCAARTNLRAEHLPDNLAAIRSAIEAAVPVGQASHKETPRRVEARWYAALKERFIAIDTKHEALATKKSPALQLGTLGGGNHFIELCLDEEGCLWVMLHSGSRNIGNRIGSYFIERAKREMDSAGVKLADRDLAYLSESSESFADYVAAVGWAQDYAKENRRAMLAAVAEALSPFFPELAFDALAIDCHHNYVEREEHFGERVWLTRKGAVRARTEDLGIIPGSMGAKSFIVRGKGNAEAFHTCSHGAGRKMSRAAARQRFTAADHARDTAGVECRKDEGVLDETPAAYKDIDAVMAAQSDLVEIVHTLKQVVCVKG